MKTWALWSWWAARSASLPSYPYSFILLMIFVPRTPVLAFKLHEPCGGLNRLKGEPPPIWRRQISCFDHTAASNPSCVSAVTPSSRPISSTILPLITFTTAVPVTRILRPVAAGKPPVRKSVKA